jgi:tetratricopeptide (TPR) repeat protein
VDDAIRLLRRASGVHPADVWVYYVLAGLLETTKPPRAEEALEAYAATRALRPELAREMAHALEARDLDGEAESIFRDLTDRRPSKSRHLACLGRHLKVRGHADEAGPILERAVALDREAVLL